ncbi:hypothetical protein ACYSNX_09990 [Myroides sp. LJL115]
MKLSNHPKESILFSDLESTWDKIKESYFYDFKLLVFGDLPTEKAIIKSLKTIKTQIDIITWNL